MVAVIIALSSIVRESSKQMTTSHFFWDFMGGVFFIVSTLPFALPWVLAFFFPRECILFFTVWAVFGAILGEVSVLVSHKQLMKGGPSTPLFESLKQPDEGPWTDEISSTQTGHDRVRPVLAKKRLVLFLHMMRTVGAKMLTNSQNAESAKPPSNGLFSSSSSSSPPPSIFGVVDCWFQSFSKKRIILIFLTHAHTKIIIMVALRPCLNFPSTTRENWRTTWCRTMD